MSIPSKRFQCGACGNLVESPQGDPKPQRCPRCGASEAMIHRLRDRPEGAEVGDRHGRRPDPSPSLFIRPGNGE